MNKKTVKILTSIAIMLVVISTFGVCFAADFPTISSIQPSSGVSSIQTIAGQALYIAQMIGVAVATIMLIVLGIKYITAAPDAKAEIKKSAWIYVVGAVGIFAATFIVNLLKDVFTKWS